jgi:hypothetical protein
VTVPNHANPKLKAPAARPAPTKINTTIKIRPPKVVRAHAHIVLKALKTLAANNPAKQPRHRAKTVPQKYWASASIAPSRSVSLATFYLFTVSLPLRRMSSLSVAFAHDVSW